MTRKRGAIYCRISLKDPNVPKVENQEAMCRKLAQASGIDVGDRIYVDDGFGASAFKDRPGWDRLLADAAAGHFDVLLAQSEDRFTRQVMEKENLLMACAASGVTWLTVNDGATDPATADGEFFSTIRAGLARMEARRKGERQRQAAEARRLSGMPQAGGDRRPFGYEPDKLTARDSEAELIREAYAGVIDGTLTPTRVAHRWNKAGVRTSRGGTWDSAKTEAVLRRPRNAGIVTYTPEAPVNGKKRKGETVRVLDEHGQPVRAKWQPLVDEETFLTAMRVLDDPSRRLTRVHEPKWLCPSLVTCASCGTPVEANTSGRGTKYRCRTFRGVSPVHEPSGPHIEITAATLDEVISRAAVDAVYFAPRSTVADPDAERLGDLRARLAAIRRDEADLLELLGAFKPAEIAAKKRQLADRAVELEEQIAAIGATNARAALLAEVQEMLTQRTSLTDAAKAKVVIRERFDGMPLDQRRALVRGMLRAEVAAGGRGATRVRVTHLVATSLNEQPYVEEPEAV